MLADDYVDKDDVYYVLHHGSLRWISLQSFLQADLFGFRFVINIKFLSGIITQQTKRNVEKSRD